MTLNGKIGKLLGGLLLAASGPAATASTGHIDGLEISVGEGWNEQENSDPERRSFLSRDGNVGVTISSLSINIRPDQTETVAVKLAESRIAGHGQWHSKNGGRAEITDPVFEEHTWGHHLEYDGRDSDGQTYSFVGFVTTHQVVSIFAESSVAGKLGDQYMHSTVQEFIQATKFDMPKIR